MKGTRKAYYKGEVEPEVTLEEMIEAGRVPVARYGNEVSFQSVSGVRTCARVDFGDDANRIELVNPSAFSNSLPCRINRSGEAEVLKGLAAKEQTVTDATLEEAKRLYPAAFE